jgi:hypothetical protein
VFETHTAAVAQRTTRSVIASRPAFSLIASAVPAGAAGGAGSSWADRGRAASGDPDCAAGAEAAQRRDWNETLARMNAVIGRDAKNAEARNYLGYAHAIWVAWTIRSGTANAR